MRGLGLPQLVTLFAAILVPAGKHITYVLVKFPAR
jgi:hypothetical protein